MESILKKIGNKVAEMDESHLNLYMITKSICDFRLALLHKFLRCFRGISLTHS